MCAMPSATFFLTFLRARADAVCCSCCWLGVFRLAISSRLASWHVHLDRRLARPLAGSGVGARALAAHGQPLAMAHTAIAAEVHQALDRHGDLATQVAFNGEAGDVLAQPLHLRVGEVLDLARGLDARGGANRLRARAADAVDRSER